MSAAACLLVVTLAGARNWLRVVTSMVRANVVAYTLLSALCCSQCCAARAFPATAGSAAVGASSADFVFGRPFVARTGNRPSGSLVALLALMRRVGTASGPA